MKMSEQIRTLKIVQDSIVDPPIMPRHATVVIMNIIGNYCWKNTYKVMAVYIATEEVTRSIQCPVPVR